MILVTIGVILLKLVLHRDAQNSASRRPLAFLMKMPEHPTNKTTVANQAAKTL